MKLSGPQSFLLSQLDGEIPTTKISGRQRRTLRSLERLGLVESVFNESITRWLGYRLTKRGLEHELDRLFR